LSIGRQQQQHCTYNTVQTPTTTSHNANMKLTTILPIIALAANAFARNVHVVGGLMAREIDPATMDPTKLSILSYLKTAVPTLTGGELALPTGKRIGDFYAQQWVEDLPPEYLVLLAQMYPTTRTTPATATPTASESDAAVSETAAASSDDPSPVSQEAAAASADASSSISEETSAAFLVASASVSQETAAASADASSSVSQEKASASAGASANASVSPTSLTKTLQTAPTATSTSNGTLSTTKGPSAVSNSAVGTGVHSTSKPSSSQPASSTGAKNTVGTGSWSVAVGLSVAALFCLLA
jgi:hypothetical protein